MTSSVVRRGVGAVRSSRVLVLFLAFVASGLLFACTDSGQDSPVGPGGSSGPIQFALVPHYHVLGSASQIAPITQARLTVLDAASRVPMGPAVTVTIDPAAPVFTLPVTFELPESVDQANVVVVVELLSVVDGIQSVEWSGVTSTISVAAGGSAPPPTPIEVFQGPAENLSVTSIAIVNKPTALVEGDSVRLAAVAQGNAAAQIFWHSTDESIATVDVNTGLVHLLRDGDVTLVAAAGPRADSAHVAVRARPTSITVSPETLRAASTGDDLLFTAIVVDARGNPVVGENVVWTSSNDGVVTSAGGGHFAAHGNGVATITATSSLVPSLHATATAVVDQRVTTMSLDVGAFEFTAIGDQHSFVITATDARGNTVTDPAVTWTSSSGAVAVDSHGTASAVASGTSTITATTPDGVSASATVTVSQVVSSLTVSPASISLTAIGDTMRIVPRAADRSGAAIPTPTVTFSTSDAGVATVDANGLVKAVGRGDATITASAAGISAVARVSVDQLAARIDVLPAEVTVNAFGVVTPFTAHVVDRNGNVMGGTISWSTSAPSVATVDASGSATSVGNGAANIIARSGTVSGFGVLNVQQSVAHVTISPKSITLGGVGSSMRFTAQAVDASGSIIANSTFAWLSLDPAIATVNDAGTVTTTGYGDARIVVSSGVGADTATLTVARPTLVISPDSIAFVGIGATQQLTTVLRETGGQENPVTASWSSTNANVASVSSTGLVTSHAVGSALIIGTFNQYADTIRVSVATTATANIRIDTVYVSPASIVAGTTPVIHIRGQSSGTTDVPATVASMQFLDGANHVLFQATQNIPPLAAGQPIVFDIPFFIPVTTPAVIAHLRITADATNLVPEISEADNVKEYNPINLIPAAPPGIVLSEDTLRFIETGAVTLSALDQNGTAVVPEFVSTHPAVASVDANGLVTPLSNGYSRIVATYNGRADTTFVQVGTGVPHIEGVTKTWIGTADPASTLFSDPNNWMPRGVPTSTDFVFVPDCAVFFYELSADYYNGGCSITLSGNTNVGGVTTGYFMYPDLDYAAGLKQTSSGFALAQNRFAAVAPGRDAASVKRQKARLAAFDSARVARSGKRSAIRRQSLRSIRSSADRDAAARSNLRQRLNIPTASQRLAAARASDDARSPIAKFNGGTSRMEQPEFHFNLNGYALNIAGNVPDFVFIGDETSETPSSRVILSGNGQQIYGLATTTALDVTGPDVHVIGGCSEYSCYGFLEARDNVSVTGALTVESDAEVYVSGVYDETDEPISGDLLVSGKLYAMNYSDVYSTRDIQVDGSNALFRADAADVTSYRDLIVTNSATFDAVGYTWIDIPGSAVVSNSATLNLGTDTYTWIGGNFSTASNGLLKMQGADADLDVYGDMSMNGASTIGSLTAGYIYLYGDLTASGTGFAPSGYQETSFDSSDETETHTITFTQSGSGAAGSHFARLFAYGAVSSATPLFVDGDGATYNPDFDEAREYDLWVCGTLTTPDITIGGSIFLCSGTNLVASHTTMTGTDGSIYVSSAEPLVTDLTVEGTAYVTALSLTGDLHVTGPLAFFTTGSSTTTVDGSLIADNSGNITIDNYSVVNVTGDVTTQTGGTFNMYEGGRLFLNGNVHLGGALSRWEDGLLHVGGNIIVDGATGLVSDETHEVTFTGEDATVHVISLPTGGPNSLGSLTVYGQQVRLVYDLHLTGNLLAQETATAHPKFFSTNGTVTLKADRTADIDHVDLVDVALDIHDNFNSENRSDVSRLLFSGFTSDRYQLTMRMDQDSNSISIFNIEFDEVAEASHGYNFVDLFGHQVTLTIDGATHGGNSSTPAGNQLTVEDAVSMIVWNSAGS